VQNNTHDIQTLTGQISRLVGMLETEKDVARCRGMVDDAVRQSSETRAVLARIREHQHQATNPAEQNNRRMMYQKLSDNLAITVRVLEDVVRRFTAEEKRRSTVVVEGAGLDMGMGYQAAVPMSTVVAPADAAGGKGHCLVSLGSSTGRTSLEEEIERDKCRALQRVDEDMVVLQRIYTDLATSAEEQQATFDTIESHMARAAADVELGRTEIEAASGSWDRRLKRKLWVTAGGALAILAAVSWLTSG